MNSLAMSKSSRRFEVYEVVRQYVNHEKVDELSLPFSRHDRGLQARRCFRRRKEAFLSGEASSEFLFFLSASDRGDVVAFRINDNNDLIELYVDWEIKVVEAPSLEGAKA